MNKKSAKCKSHPDIYVLMRFYCPEDADELFYEYLNTAIGSIAESDYDGKVILLINDDTPTCRVLNGPSNRLKGYLRKYKFTLDGEKKNCYLISTDGKGSAYATFYMRQKFLELTKRNYCCPINVSNIKNVWFAH